MPQTYTFDTVGPAIQRYIERATLAAVKGGLVPDLGIEMTDTVRVKSGRNSHTTASVVGETVRDTDPGKAPGNYARDYPPRFFPPATRHELEGGAQAAKFGETVSLIQTAPYSAARESLDGAVQASIDETAKRWPVIGKRAARNVRVA